MNECPKKRDHSTGNFIEPNHQFFGDMLVLRVVKCRGGHIPKILALVLTRKFRKAKTATHTTKPMLLQAFPI